MKQSNNVESFKMHVKVIIMKTLFFILSLCVSFWVSANEMPPSDTAKQWLESVDAGKYAKSWEVSDTFFKSQLTSNKWDSTLKAVRVPLGNIISRTQTNSSQHNSLPGVPDGEYLVIEYKTEFEHKKSSTETLTLSKSSGQWRPIGYFIK